jgi:catechol 2,3-dioxygenase-like lactoylglutathione lyase family enzyme
VQILGITQSVTSLEKSRRFYEDVLGFEPDAAYEPTRWQSYRVQEGVFYAIGEKPGSTDEVALLVDDIEALWERVKNRREIVAPLEHTAWGTYRFVIRDPDGHELAFAQRKIEE